MTDTGTPAPAPSGLGYGKVTAATAAGVLATIVVGVIDQLIGKPLAPEMVSLIQMGITSAVVYFAPHDMFGGS